MARHGQPAHGLGLAHDNRALWVTGTYKTKDKTSHNPRDAPAQDNMLLLGQRGYTGFFSERTYLSPFTKDNRGKDHNK